MLTGTGCTEIVKYLVERGADYNCKDNNNVTPLYFAAYKGHIEIVKYLVERGADVNCKDNNNDTPLYVAAANGHTEIVKYLIRECSVQFCEKTKTDLAWLMLSGLGGTKVDEDGAVALLEERVKDKDTDAMWILGVCNEFGIGTEQDIERAENLYQESHRRGNKIGGFFVENKGTKRGSGVMKMNRLRTQIQMN